MAIRRSIGLRLLLLRGATLSLPLMASGWEAPGWAAPARASEGSACHRDFAGLLVRRAIVFAKQKHAGEFRKFDGLPYVVHPVRVTKTVKLHTQDSEVLAASYLHDVIENTPVSLEEIRGLFGERVARLVEELTSDPTGVEAFGKAPYLLQKMNAMSEEALLIKLADRLDNVSDFDRAPEKFVKKYTEETRFILEGLNRPLSAAHRTIIREIRVLLERGANPAP